MRTPSDYRAKIALTRYDRRAAYTRGNRHLPEEPMASLIVMRHQKGMTQQQVAQLMGVSTSAIQHWETHQGEISMSSMRRYAHAVEALMTSQVGAA